MRKVYAVLLSSVFLAAPAMAASHGGAMEGNGRAAMRFLRRLVWIN
jgi:hypothetical protein